METISIATIEPHFKAILKELHSKGLLYMEATDQQIREAYKRVRTNGKKKSSRLPLHKSGYGLL